MPPFLRSSPHLLLIPGILPVVWRVLVWPQKRQSLIFPLLSARSSFCELCVVLFAAAHHFFHIVLWFLCFFPLTFFFCLFLVVLFRTVPWANVLNAVLITVTLCVCSLLALFFTYWCVVPSTAFDWDRFAPPHRGEPEAKAQTETLGCLAELVLHGREVPRLPLRADRLLSRIVLFIRCVLPSLFSLSSSFAHHTRSLLPPFLRLFCSLSLCCCGVVYLHGVLCCIIAMLVVCLYSVLV